MRPTTWNKLVSSTWTTLDHNLNSPRDHLNHLTFFTWLANSFHFLVLSQGCFMAAPTKTSHLAYPALNRKYIYKYFLQRSKRGKPSIDFVSLHIFRISNNGALSSWPTHLSDSAHRLAKVRPTLSYRLNLRGFQLLISSYLF